MSFILKLKELIPNPYSNKQSLAGLIKKEELISSGFSLFSIANKIFTLALAVFIFGYFLKIPTSVLVIIFSIELVVTLVNLGIIFLKIKSIKQVNSQKDSLSSWKLLQISEYYRVVTNGFATAFNIFGVFIFILILDNGLLNLNAALNIIIYIKYFLFAVIISRLFRYIISLVKYQLVKKIPKSTNIAELDKDYYLVNLKFAIIRDMIGLISLILIIIFLLFSGIMSKEIKEGVLAILKMLYLFLIPLLIFPILLTVYDIFSYRKIKKLKFDKPVSILENQPANPETIIKTSEYQDEVILGSVFGITRAVASFKDIFSRKMGSSEFLGVGRNFSPENTMLISNHRLLFIQIPVTGGDKVLDGTDYTMMNFIWNRSEISDKGKEILKINSISQILPLVRNEVSYNDISSLVFNKFIINIKMSNGDKLRYGFMDKEYTELINKILPKYLGSKFLSK